jgi:hypothetical protein
MMFFCRFDVAKVNPFRNTMQVKSKNNFRTNLQNCKKANNGKGFRK